MVVMMMAISPSFSVLFRQRIGRAGIEAIVFLAADDTESEKCHLGGIVVRDYSCIVSNYRSQKTLDEYLKEQVRPKLHSCYFPIISGSQLSWRILDGMGVEQL